MHRPRKRASSIAGMTLLELIIATGILVILAGAAMPLARITIKREKEAELHADLREIRNAIDRYKDDADNHLIMTEQGSENYPPDLDTLVKGVQVGAHPTGTGTPLGTSTQQQQLVRYLRKIPVDPMTGRAEWGLRSVSDDPTSTSWGGKNVFDVYSLSTGTAMNDTKYADW
jgi:general secretion pathway protein G